jgi:hypothetical protein
MDLVITALLSTLVGFVAGILAGRLSCDPGPTPRPLAPNHADEEGRHRG